ncbi:MAG: response regulator [Zavarzinella sp.]
MADFFFNLFNTNGFPARWNCGTWTAGHGWLHIIADSAIFAAYFAIPCLLAYFVLRRRDLPFPPIFWLFAMFILSCGIGHAIEASIFWHPWYRLSGFVKMITAIVSWATVIGLIPLIPKALSLPGLAAVNKQLREEIARREIAVQERQKLETQMLQAQKLESMGILAGGIAHDFNNILTGILGYIDLARMDLPEDSPVQHYMNEVVNNAQKAAGLAHQMLAYSGKGKFVVEPVNLSNLVEDGKGLCAISVSKKCKLSYDLDDSIPECDADSTQLNQVLMNLVINASESLHDQPGEIHVRTGVMYCERSYLSDTYLDETLPEGEYVYLEVEDNGSGMSEETQSRLFDPFFTTKFTGRGLGLAAVFGIIRGHHGAIKVSSIIGEGSSFRALFPVSSSAQRVVEMPLLPVSTYHGQGKVLVVDDELVIRELATNMLQRMGFEVIVARDGQEGIEQYKAHASSIQLVLLDLLMPRLDGVEASVELRKINPQVRIVLTSGYNEQVASTRFVHYGMAGFLQKPYLFEQMATVIEKALVSDDAEQPHGA